MFTFFRYVYGLIHQGSGTIARRGGGRSRWRGSPEVDEDGFVPLGHHGVRGPHGGWPCHPLFSGAPPGCAARLVPQLRVIELSSCSVTYTTQVTFVNGEKCPYTVRMWQFRSFEISLGPLVMLTVLDKFLPTSSVIL